MGRQQQERVSLSISRRSDYSFDRIPTRWQRLEDARSRRWQQCGWIVLLGLLLWVAHMTIVPAEPAKFMRGGNNNNNEKKVKDETPEDDRDNKLIKEEPEPSSPPENAPQNHPSQQHEHPQQNQQATATTTASAAASPQTTQATVPAATTTQQRDETPSSPSPPDSDCPAASESHCHTVQCLPSSATNFFSVPPPPESGTASLPNCKLLWIVGFHTHAAETMFNDTWTTDCPECLMYAQALDSVVRHAPDTIQPVVLLQKGGMKPKGKSFFQFAQARGAATILHPVYSFHKLLQKYPNKQGSFWAMEAPQIVQQYNGRLHADGWAHNDALCPNKALVTSPHVLFTNPISFADIHAILNLLTPPAAVAFAQDALAQERISDMVLVDTERMQDAPGHMVAFLKNNTPTTSTLTQDAWMNAYYNQNAERQAAKTTLPLEWNWKPYWNGTTLDQVKIVHTDFATHSARATHNVPTALAKMASCEWLPSHHNSFDDATIAAMHQGICCDHGHNAGSLLQEWNTFLQNTTLT